MASANAMIYFLATLLLIAGISAKSSKEFEIVGPCINAQCPHSYTCNRDECIREKPKARTGTVAIGPCINTQCPVGHICIGNENQCYPTA